MIVGRTRATLHRRTVTGQDDYGNDVWANVTLPLDGCTLHPRTSSEETGSRATVITGAWLYAPTGTIIDPDDEIEVNGVRYDVDGEPGIWPNFTGGFALQQVALRRVTG